MPDSGGGSVTIPMLGLVAGYAILSFGYVLLRGWSITIGDWLNPLKGYQWPAGGADPDPIPPGQLFAGSATSASAGPFPYATPPAALPAIGATVAPTNGKCPPGFTLQGGKCVSLRTASGLH